MTKQPVNAGTPKTIPDYFRCYEPSPRPSYTRNVRRTPSSRRCAARRTLGIAQCYDPLSILERLAPYGPVPIKPYGSAPLSPCGPMPLSPYEPVPLSPYGPVPISLMAPYPVRSHKFLMALYPARSQSLMALSP